MSGDWRRPTGPFTGGLPSGVIGRSGGTMIRRPTGRVEAIDPWPKPGWPDPDSGPPAGPGGSYTERTYAAPGTVLDQVIPMVYGSMKVPGYCAAWSTGPLYLDMAFIFCHGEQAALGSIEINDEAITGLSGWVTDYHTFLGGGSGLKPTEMSFVDSTTWTRMLDYCMLTVRIRMVSANCPGSFQVTAVPTGRKFASFRSPYTESNHTNLAEIAYDILTDAAWKGLSSSVAGIEAGGTWETFADHCDEVMGDATKRYTFNGVIKERDPDRAIDLVLEAGFASKYFSSDGKIQIWSEAPPPAITGTWTAAASATLTGSGGDATNEVEADDIVYAGNTPAIVVSVGGANSITLDRAVTISAEKVRLTSGVYLKRENWIEVPGGREAETGAIPDEVLVRYTLSNYWGSVMYPEIPTEDKRVEVTVEACNNASMARRISETKKNLLALQPFSWAGVADTHASGLEPGDVFFFDDDVLTFQPARVLSPVSQDRGGLVGLGFQAYSIAAVSNSTQTDPTIPTQPTAYVSSGTPHFRAINSVNSSGDTYNFFRWQGTSGTVGDATVVQVLDGVSIRLPNGVPLLGINYAGDDTFELLKVDAANRIILGDGGETIYINSSNQIVLPSTGQFVNDYSVKKAMLGWNNSSASYTFGNTDYDLKINADDLLFEGYYKNRTAWPTTGSIAANQWTIWENTTANGIRLYVNDGSSLWYVALNQT